MVESGPRRRRPAHGSVASAQDLPAMAAHQLQNHPVDNLPHHPPGRLHRQVRLDSPGRPIRRVRLPCLYLSAHAGDRLLIIGNNSPYDWNCENHYFANASEPWDASLYNPPPGSGRYHSQCRGLYAWAQLTLAVGILSCLRALYQILKTGIFDSYTDSTKRSAEHGNKLRRATADAMELVGAFASAVAAVLYLVSAVLLGTSRLFTGPRTEGEWYKPLYVACLSLVCLNCVASTHQAVILTLAGYVRRRRRRWAAHTALDVQQQQRYQISYIS
ncbi:uncharacterized protein F5Z01DRAFT_557696 [Emericellopsis atlantica]|uniref:Uncharacterized protein n=1 Tax=Emericellopsis atlantica TaxID=2614577 RepID=A0A9P7ZPA8_9HYPO|nr:uncharacterized protein F5Z01DRAFT_557696 [Emericellopsis atlantica]KAG9255788.1 hypothetical protein F5Z01DRAFT_557696 [Emericellopsis atlantica]